MTDPCRGLIVWPSQTPDPLLFDTTLYFDDSSHHYSDKEWTLLVEECTRKGKRKAIAAVNLNMSLFVQVCCLISLNRNCVEWILFC